MSSFAKSNKKYHMFDDLLLNLRAQPKPDMSSSALTEKQIAAGYGVPKPDYWGSKNQM
jgi:hypothetical protein